MIIQRYIAKDILKAWVAILVVVLLIATSNKLVRLISKAAMGDLSPTLLLQLIGLQIPELIAFLIPLSLFLAILITLGRLSVDQELTAYFALGGSWAKLMTVMALISLLAMGSSGLMTLWWVPKLELQKDHLLAQEESTALLQALNKGRFYSFQNDRLVFYVEDISSDKKVLHEVFIAEQPVDPVDDKDWTVVAAMRGHVIVNKDNGHTFLELEQGNRYDGMPGEQDYLTVEFDKYGKLIEKKAPTPGIYMYGSMPTTMLWGTPNTALDAELQWRISIPLSAPILCLLAVPLSRLPPRKGRFHRLFPAILIFIAYYNLITVCKRWVAQGSLEPWVGVWWVHLLFLCLGMGLIAQSSGRLKQMIYRSPRYAV